MNKNKLSLAAISLSGIGKKFNNRWIFNNIDFTIQQGDKLSITGNNGSGKSTLLQIIAGYVSPSAGNISWQNNSGEIPNDQIFHYLSLASPYLELIEDFTLRENVDFFCKMKSLSGNKTSSDLIAEAKLEEAADRQIKYFSSGMKQRTKLALAFLADTQLLLLDEPLSNLDSKGYDWYKTMVEKYSEGRTVIVCSNQVKDEIDFCNKHLNIEPFKQNQF